VTFRRIELTLLNAVVTVGVSLTIPLALIVSIIILGSDLTLTVTTLLGAGMVILGFCLLGWQGWAESKEVAVNDEQSLLEQDRRISAEQGI